MEWSSAAFFFICEINLAACPAHPSEDRLSVYRRLLVLSFHALPHNAVEHLHELGLKSITKGFCQPISKIVLPCDKFRSGERMSFHAHTITLDFPICKLYLGICQDSIFSS